MDRQKVLIYSTKIAHPKNLYNSVFYCSFPKSLNINPPPLSQQIASTAPHRKDIITLIRSALNRLTLEDIPNVVKHPIHAPGINHSHFTFDCQHIVAEITPAISAANATEEGINPDIAIATKADTIPDKVVHIAVTNPSIPCFPQAKYAVHPANPTHVIRPKLGIDEIYAHIPQAIPVPSPKENKKLILFLLNFIYLRYYIIPQNSLSPYIFHFFAIYLWKNSRKKGIILVKQN